MQRPESIKALPLGNGSLGLMVFGDVNRELYLGEENNIINKQAELAEELREDLSNLRELSLNTYYDYFDE